MPRVALIFAVVFLAAVSTGIFAVDPHVDPSFLPGGCPSCHVGHGRPGSPMMQESQVDLCMRCHDTEGKTNNEVMNGRIDPSAAPALLNLSLKQPFSHPMNGESFSSDDPTVVVCTSCHSPHRNSTQRQRLSGAGGRKKFSTRNPTRLEYELCQDCHGGAGSLTQDRSDISRLYNPNSRSYHPIETATSDRSPSVGADLEGQEINCTDCHGNSNPKGPRGLHGSGVRFLLNRAYATVDGQEESAEQYALCYDCHDRDQVLDSDLFPLHREHVVDQMISCASCHDPHGSVENRSLIRIGEDTVRGGVSESISTGILAFDSDLPGSGTCYVTCHAYDHGPATYGEVLPSSRAPERRKRSLRQGERGDRPVRRPRR